LQVSYKIYENDFAVDDYIPPDPISTNLVNGVAKTTWTARQIYDGPLGGDPEFYFKASAEGLEIKSDDLTVSKYIIPVCNNNGQCENGETYENCPDDCPEPQSGTNVQFDPASISASNGDTVAFDIKVSNINNLYGFQFDIAYDPNILEFQDIQEGTFLNNNGKDNTFCVDYQQSAGLIKNIACTRVGSGYVDGSGVLERVTFKAIGTGQSDVTLMNVLLADSSSNEIESTNSDGLIDVS
jgi:plastocyanin